MKYKRCIGDNGVPREDMECLCKTAVDALPEFSFDDPETVALYDRFLASLRARANREMEALDGLGSARTDAESTGVSIYGSVIRRAPALLAYAGLLAYVVGRLYLNAYNGALLPGQHLEYGYFPTIASLVALLPMSIAAWGWLMPVWSAGMMMTPTRRDRVMKMVSAAKRANDYMDLSTRVVRKMVTSAVPDTQYWIVKVSHRVSQLRMTFRLMRQQGAIRRHAHLHAAHRIGALQYLPLAALEGGDFLTGALVVCMAAAAALTPVVYLLLSWAWPPLVVAAAAIPLFGLVALLTAAPIRFVVMAFRERRAIPVAWLTVTFLLSALIAATGVAGHIDAGSNRAMSPTVSVGTSDGMIRHGQLLSTPSSPDVFLLSGAEVVRIPATSVESVSMTDQAPAPSMLASFAAMFARGGH